MFKVLANFDTYKISSITFLNCSNLFFIAKLNYISMKTQSKNFVLNLKFLTTIKNAVKIKIIENIG